MSLLIQQNRRENSGISILTKQQLQGMKRFDSLQFYRTAAVAWYYLPVNGITIFCQYFFNHLRVCLLQINILGVCLYDG